MAKGECFFFKSPLFVLIWFTDLTADRGIFKDVLIARLLYSFMLLLQAACTEIYLYPEIYFMQYCIFNKGK